MARKLGAALALSFAIHAGVVGGAAAVKEMQKSQRERELERARSAQVEGQDRRAEVIRMKKELLVKQAQAAVRDGTFKLDWFLFRVREIRAEEKGEIFDFGDADSRYDGYLQALAERLPADSFEEFFQEIHDTLNTIQYFGAPGGNMPDLVVDGGGGCEPISHLIVSLLGRFPGTEGKLFFRVYSDHLAPILEQDGKYYDVWAGAESDGRGVLIRADDLVELYARRHGVAQEGVCMAPEGGRFGDESDFAYPKTDDAYSDGPVPLFASNAMGGIMGGERGARGGGKEAGLDEYYPQAITHGEEKLVRLAMNPFPRLLGPDWAAYAPTFEASEELLAKLSESISRTETALQKNYEERMVKVTRYGKPAGEMVIGVEWEPYWRMLALGQLSGLCRLAEITARGLGKVRVAGEAGRRAGEATREGEELINGIGVENIDARDFDNSAIPFGLAKGNLLMLGEAGEKLLLRIAGDNAEYAKMNVLASMYLNPGTQARAAELFSNAPKQLQMLIAEEIYSWGSTGVEITVDMRINGAAPDWEDSKFGRIFRAYSGFEGQMREIRGRRWENRNKGIVADPDFSEIIRIAEAEAGRNGLGREWAAILIQRFFWDETFSNPMRWFCEGDYCKLPRGSMMYLGKICDWLKSARGSIDPEFLEAHDTLIRIAESIRASGAFTEDAMDSAWDAEAMRRETDLE